MRKIAALTLLVLFALTAIAIADGGMVRRRSTFSSNGTDQWSNVSGNVGIGTSSPAQKLAVSGNAIISGDITGNSDFHLKHAGEIKLILQSTTHDACSLYFMRDDDSYDRTDWRMKNDSAWLQWQYSFDEGETWTNAMQIAGDTLAFECFNDVRIEGDLSTNAHMSATGSLYYALLDVNGKLKGRSANKYPGFDSGGGTWGSITGTLSAQTDLQNALDAKLNTDGTLTGVVHSTVTGNNSYLSSNLGIGTTTPSRKLDVVGDAKFSGDLSGQTATFGSINTYGTIVANQVYSGYMKALTLDAYGDYLIIDDGVSIGDDTTVTGSIATSGGPLKISSNLSPSYVTNGNFGVGTTSPTALLHVNGNAILGTATVGSITSTGSYVSVAKSAYINGDATVTGTTYVDTLEMASSDMELGGELSADSVLAADLTISKLVSPTGTVYFATVDSAGKFGKSALKYGAVSGGASNAISQLDSNVTVTDASNGYISMTEDGTEYVRLTGANVGIGTTAPTSKLHINSAAVSSGREYLLKGAVSDSGSDLFCVANGTGYDSTFLPMFTGYINSRGDRYSLGFQGLVSSAYDASDSSAYGIVDFAAMRTSSDTDPINGTLSDVSNRRLFTFRGGNGAETSDFKMVILASGNVGIGTTAPTQKLDVSGTVKATTFSGSGSGLSSTSIPIASINATGTASSSTYLRGDGAWETPAGGGTPGGSDTQIQFNDGGSFGGDSGLTYEKTSNRLTLDGDLSVNNCLTVRESWCNTVGYFNGDTIKTMNSAFYLDGPSNNTLMSCVGGDLSLIGNVVSGQKLYFSNNTSTNEVNYTTAAYAAGTKYTMTTTSAKVDFGTTDPAVTLPVAGTYMLYASANLSVTNGFSITPNTALPVSFKLYRTTSTAADIANTPISIYINNLSDSGCRVVLPPVEYTATAGSIAIELRGNMGRSPAAGNIYIDDAEIVAVRTKR